MQQLQFVELDEGGRLVLTGDDGSRYAVAVDDRLRAALRPRREGSAGAEGGPAVSPRDVQAMIRAGQPAEDVAASTGWPLERVHRFEGPVLAEREHVVGLAQRAPVRAHGRTDGSHTLDRRVRERLQSRGVDLTVVSWDAARGEAHGPWTVIVGFLAGGRERRAAWHYDVRTRAVDALDDEARWLSEDEQALPGGLEGHPLLGGGHGEDEAAADLMATMRERRQRRGRRSQPSRRSEDDPSHVPGQQEMPDEVLPLEDLAYDPDTMGDPPAAHPRGSAPEAPHPVEVDEGVDERTEVEPQATADPETAVEPPSPEEAQRAVGRGGRARKRRGLRLPKVPSPADEGADDHEPEQTFARTRQDPQEVTFDEFFGTDEDDLDEEPAPYVDYVEPPEVEDEARQGEDAPESEQESPATGGTGQEPEADDEGGDTEESEVAESELAESDAAHEPGDDEPGESAAPSSRKGRTSVPSWDDIMFGSRDRR